MARFLVLFAVASVAFLLLGCTASNAPAPAISPTPTTLASPSSTAVAVTASASPSPTAYVSADPSIGPTVVADSIPPRISSSSASPSNPDRNEPFVLEVSAVDDVSLKSISWESSEFFSSQPESKSFDCASQASCSVSWTFKSATDGKKTISVYATDSSGQASSRSSMEFTVRPFDYKAPTPTPAPSASIASGPVCGNAVCDSKEGFEVCPADCPYAGFACANAKCEGGESYESCPQDCSVSDIVGSACGDGACEPGEDAAYCPKDCASIKPNCGNNICDSWETESSCRADCEGVSGTETSCSSNEACGYKQVCQSGKCVSVQCTNDAQCGYGKECESNRCVRCPSGPYGPAC